MERIQQVFRRTLDRPDLCLLPEHSARDVPGWDSLAHVNLVLALEKEFGVRLRAALLARLRNVEEMALHIEEKQRL
jgi:acyl carrier protein